MCRGLLASIKRLPDKFEFPGKVFLGFPHFLHQFKSYERLSHCI
jgi:hypothetical protein